MAAPAEAAIKVAQAETLKAAARRAVPARAATAAMPRAAQARAGMAATGGEVVYAGPADTYGPMRVEIELPDGSILIYVHLSDFRVVVGATVLPGMIVRYSGDSNGSHLHVAIKAPDSSTQSGFEPIDPVPVLILGELRG